VYDQGHLASCTAHVIAAAIQFDQLKQRLPSPFLPSRLYIYYNGRALEGTTQSDSGEMIRDAIKSVAALGACPERLWPYDPATVRTRPPDAAYQAASWHKAVSYQRLDQDVNQMKGCLASGYPFAFGFTAYQSIESPAVAQSGVVAMPRPDEAVIGTHAVLAVGYDDARQWFIVRNSWGAGWGMHGYFTLPYSYLAQESLASDFWTIRLVR
jgi:C1A family cysteine protease